MELRVRGYSSRRRVVTPLRALVVLVLLGVAIWKLGPRVWARKRTSTPAPVAAQPAPPPPPQAAESPAARSAAQESAELKADVAALTPKFTENIAAFAKLKADVDAASSIPRDYPYKVQLVGADIDHVPVRSVAARQFQTRFVRILYDAARELAEVARGRRDSAVHKAAFDKTTDALKQFESDWSGFAKKG